MKKVAVVILNYRVREFTLKCLASVKKSDYGNIEIIAVDNNSGDGLEEKLAGRDDVIFLQTGDNLGYSGGNNVGIKKALADRADFVFILNPDTTVEKQTISSLVNVLGDERIGIAAPKIYFAGSKKIWFAGGEIDLANVLGGHTGIDQPDRGQFDKIREVDYATGAAMMVGAGVFEKIGLFDEDYFLYYEDLDFSYRARQAGFKVVFVPHSLVDHANAKSTGLGSPLQDYFIWRNRMLFAAKFLPLRTRLALFRQGLGNLDNPIRRRALIDFLSGKLRKGSFIP